VTAHPAITFAYDELCAWLRALNEPQGDDAAAELTRLKEENERLRKELDDARGWSPEMKAAAMADAQKVCDLTTTLEELLRVMEPVANIIETEEAVDIPPMKLVIVECGSFRDYSLTIDNLRSLSEAYRKAKGK
jgi:hypothetical protein